MNFNLVIENLKASRNIFHSEDDLKFEMSIIIKELYPKLRIRLERPTPIQMVTKSTLERNITRAPIDIVVIDTESKIIYPIEIKYKTKLAKILNNDEQYDLTSHGANDIGRYSFRKDIYRIENFDIDINGFKNFEKKGFVFILTNDKAYYKNDVSSNQSLNRNLSFRHGAIIKPEYKGWYYQNLPENRYILDIRIPNNSLLKKHWTTGKEYAYDLTFSKEYQINWEEYSNLFDQMGKAVQFKYCLIKVGRHS